MRTIYFDVRWFEKPASRLSEAVWFSFAPDAVDAGGWTLQKTGRGLDFNDRQPPLRRGMHFNLYNNVRGTNFPMCYGEDARFRFTLSVA